MNTKIKNIVISCSFGIFLVLFMIVNIFAKDKEISYEERRKLSTFPKFKVEDILNGDYFEQMEEYFLDQFYLRENFRKVKAFDSYVVKPAITAKMAGKIFKATGGSVKLTKNNKSITFLFEAVRREQDWQKKLVDKMTMYKEFYENFVPGDSGYSSMPQLILICEDDKHTAEAFREIVTNKVEIPQIKLYFTTDLRQNEETLENTLIEFKIDEKTNKYKMFNVEAKILGI